MTGQERYRIECVLDDAFKGLHNVPEKIHWHDAYAKVSVRHGNLSTFDSDALTRLVFSAHDWCVRVQLCDGGPGRVGLMLHPRHAREGSFYERHPTLAQAVETWRSTHGIEEGL